MSEAKKGTEVKKWDEVNGAAAGEILEAFLSSEADGYAILQMNDSVEGMQFMRYDFVQSQGFHPEINFYDTVYAGPLNTQSQDIYLILDNLFMRFNVERPEDFTGHSLSMSDIVALKRDGEISYHYVDAFGFREVPNFQRPENYLKSAEMAVEDDFGMIDGTINNGKSAALQPEKKPSVVDQLKKQPASPKKDVPARKPKEEVR